MTAAKSVTATFVPFTVAAPTDVSATAGNGKVTISWNTVSGATSYNIYWSTTAGVTKTNGTKITNATSPYSHTGRTNGTTYYYIVTAVNTSGESVASAQVSATPTNIPTPLQIQVHISREWRSDGYIAIEYSASIMNNGIYVNNAIVTVNGFNVPRIVGFIDGYYDLREYDTPSPNYVPGQDYTVVVQYDGNVYTDTMKAPGGFTSNTDLTQVQWVQNGMYGTLEVAHLYGSTTYTIPYAKPGALSSPQSIPSSAYPSAGTYTVSLWAQNIKDSSFGSLSGDNCYLNITDYKGWQITK